MDTKTYKTKDIFEASYIYSEGIHFVGLESGGNYYWFVFQNVDDTCSKLSQNYWAGLAIGNIKNFVASQKTLKDLIFSKGASYGSK